jgi:glycosyltransferase involved in cell wall biosynthesis
MPHRPRILFVNHTAQPGGGEIALFNLVHHLDRTRFHVAVVFLSHGPLIDQLRATGVETHVLDAGDVVDIRKDSLDGKGLLHVRQGMETARIVWRLSRLIRRCRADIVHANSLKADLIAGAAGRLAGTPVIWHVRDRIADDYLPRKVAMAFRWLSRYVPRFVVANSRATLQTLGKLSDSRSAVVHDGTPILPLPVAAPADRTGPVIGLVGRISRWKGQDVFLRAAAKVLHRFPAAQFQVIGGPLFGEEAFEREVHALAATLGIRHAVAFTGFRRDVRELIGGLDVLVHASTVPEPFGQVVIEGMCAAKPAIATAGGGVLEIVRDGQTGHLVPMGDDAGMAVAIEKLLADPVRAAAMGRAGRRRVVEHFSIERTASRVEAVYERLLWGDEKDVPHEISPLPGPEWVPVPTGSMS